jgi:protein-disulfide isomerase
MVMSRKSAVRHAARSPESNPHAHAPVPSAPAATWPLVLGAVFVGLSAAMALLLVVEHLGGLSLPGCGEGGACAQAAQSVWGKIKLGSFVWPVSYLGLAYFLAALVAWIATRAAVPQAFRYLVRLGALGSLGFCVIIVLERLLCPYCLAAHVGNFAFWITLERTRRRPPRTGLALGSMTVVFVLVSAVLGVLDWRNREQLRRKGEQELAEATQSIIERSHQPVGPATKPATTQPATKPTPATQPVTTQPPATAPAVSASAPSQPASGPAFAGRYRYGPEVAPIRIVIFTDYQCQDCYNIETQQLTKLLAERNDISVSIKHFPFNKECNPNVDRDLHPNACWAARAAEAAGILWGNEGFWKLHHWLFAHRGVFETTAQLEAGIRELGYDPKGFVETMSSEETLRRIREDVKEAKVLGLHFTPMILINGVELKGWYAPNALLRTVAQLAATNPPPRTAADDHPPTALAKYIADWREQTVRQLPADTRTWLLGPADADLKIVLWGDYQEPYTAGADATIRAFVARRSDASYTFRHFPFNSDCNPQLKERRHPQACRAAQAAEAAGRLGGNDAYWKMHVWLMAHEDEFSDQTLTAAATEIGLAADALFSTLASDEVQAAIAEDVEAGKQLPTLRWGAPPGVHAIPTIFINSRYVPRFQLEEKSVLDVILDAAAEGRGSP